MKTKAQHSGTPYRSNLLIVASVALVCLMSPFAMAGEFSVTPITLIFEGDIKTGVITIKNDADKNLNVQMKAFEWTEDEKGQEQYTETSDIIFFPKMMTIDKKQERVLRTGIKGPLGTKEKTYRLFIQEIPEPKHEDQAALVQVAIRFGVPIFVKPIKTEILGKIEKVMLEDGQIHTLIRNIGNSHFVIQSITLAGSDRNGKETFSKELSGWYLLAGAGRTYSTPITQEVCRDTARVNIAVKTNEFVLDDRLDVDKSFCLP